MDFRFGALYIFDYVAGVVAVFFFFETVNLIGGFFKFDAKAAA